MSLFESITINGVTLPNRIVKSAMGEGMADAQGWPSPALAQLYARWARGGVGLLISGIASVRPGCSITGKELGLHDDALVAPMREVTDAAHRFVADVMAVAQYIRVEQLRERGED